MAGVVTLNAYRDDLTSFSPENKSLSSLTDASGTAVTVACGYQKAIGPTGSRRFPAIGDATPATDDSCSSAELQRFESGNTNSAEELGY
jgi:hypothetical protein